LTFLDSIINIYCWTSFTKIWRFCPRQWLYGISSQIMGHGISPYVGGLTNVLMQDKTNWHLHSLPIQKDSPDWVWYNLLASRPWSIILSDITSSVSISTAQSLDTKLWE
jgi:hypothetical protein